MPFLLHEIVTLCVKSFEELGDECVAVAYAVALGEQLMQREVVPS